MLYCFQSINGKTIRLRNTCMMISSLRIYSSLYLGERILKWWCHTYFIPNHSYLLYVFLYCINILITVSYIENQGEKWTFSLLSWNKLLPHCPKNRYIWDAEQSNVGISKSVLVGLGLPCSIEETEMTPSSLWLRWVRIYSVSFCFKFKLPWTECIWFFQSPFTPCRQEEDTHSGTHALHPSPDCLLLRFY